MSTRALIVYGTKSIYSHSDGYPSWLGKNLFENYNDESKIKVLFDLGDVSVLGKTLHPRYTCSQCSKNRFDTYGACPHCAIKEKAQCNPAGSVFYGRDRGEPNTQARTVKGLYKQAKQCWAEYVYKFVDGKWYYTDTYNDKEKPFQELTPNAWVDDTPLFPS